METPKSKQESKESKEFRVPRERSKSRVSNILRATFIVRTDTYVGISGVNEITSLAGLTLLSNTFRCT